jgi:hypothetical protein
MVILLIVGIAAVWIIVTTPAWLIGRHAAKHMRPDPNETRFLQWSDEDRKFVRVDVVEANLVESNEVDDLEGWDEDAGVIEVNLED